ncbi:unnamed protein product [Prunus armeniaca]|uniref:Uncharacterized protein n=1 Tax=Prunus armeniaca TaxID=36596 RepID=A0A6J5TMW3_PRUAR|nr:unnamed protein product [Prunus armeniaca]CAB4296020.1 unnamed protein product [Prunus armeniaca]
MKKGLESIDQYLQKIKDSRDPLSAVGVPISDEDVVILALKGLPSDYNIKAIIRGRENVISLKEFQSQLKAEEATIEETFRQIPFMSAIAATHMGFSPPPLSGMSPQSGPPMPYSAPSAPAFPYQPNNGNRGSSFHHKGKGNTFYNNGPPHNNGVRYLGKAIFLPLMVFLGPAKPHFQQFHFSHSVPICQICNKK